MWNRAALCCCLVLSGIVPQTAFGQGGDEIRATYTKYEYRIPMRDGKRLFTAVYVPKDNAKTYPIMLCRTPYGVSPYGVDHYKNDLGPSPQLAKSGYIFVYQDVRGRWMSEGEMVNMRPHVPHKQGPQDIDESSDAYDTIDWLVQHVAGNNGRVGIWGVSYPGFYAACGLIDAHPALVCGSPQAPICDWFVGDDWHHNGALMLPHAFGFMSSFARPRPAPTTKFQHSFDYGTSDGYRFFLEMGPVAQANPRHFQNQLAFWNDIMEHDTYDDFWKARNIRPHLKNIRPAVLTVGGWFDAENLFGALETYENIEASSPQTGNRQVTENRLVMGPWSHGQWTRDSGLALGNASFNSKTAEFYREHIEFSFFEKHLKGTKSQADENAQTTEPEAWIFETGTNQWRQYATWPPQETVPMTLSLAAGNALELSGTDDSSELRKPSRDLGAAAEDQNENSAEFDEYTSDPAKPVPYLDSTVIGMAKEYMTADQRFASRRPDVISYRSAVLDRDVTIAGPIDVDLFVSTSGTDSDWIVKVIDVYPDDFPAPKENPQGVVMGGYEQLVRGDVMRGKFRNSFEQPEPFVPGQPTRVRFVLPDVCHTFRAGHRILVHVQSSWFPLVDRNPQKFVDINQALPEDFQKAVQRVYHSSQHPSRLIVRTLSP